jgi:hypothetical protein
MGGRATDLGRAETEEDFDIAFDVPSETNGCAASDLIHVPGRRAWGVLYEIADDDIRGRRADGKRTLARIEGQRYEEKPIRVRDAHGALREAITFLVKDDERRENLATGAWYVSWIVYGLRDHGVPEQYIQHVVEVAITTNGGATADWAAEQSRIIGKL